MLCKTAEACYIGAGNSALPARHRIGGNAEQCAQLFLAFTRGGTRGAYGAAQFHRIEHARKRLFPLAFAQKLFESDAEYTGEISQLRYIRFGYAPLPL